MNNQMRYFLSFLAIGLFLVSVEIVSAQKCGESGNSLPQLKVKKKSGEVEKQEGRSEAIDFSDATPTKGCVDSSVGTESQFRLYSRVFTPPNGYEFLPPKGGGENGAFVEIVTLPEAIDVLASPDSSDEIQIEATYEKGDCPPFPLKGEGNLKREKTGTGGQGEGGETSTEPERVHWSAKVGKKECSQTVVCPITEFPKSDVKFGVSQELCLDKNNLKSYKASKIVDTRQVMITPTGTKNGAKEKLDFVIVDDVKVQNGETKTVTEFGMTKKIVFKNNNLSVKMKGKDLPARDFISESYFSLEINNPGGYDLKLSRKTRIDTELGERATFRSSGSSKITVEGPPEADALPIGNPPRTEQLKEAERKYEKLLGSESNARKFFRAQAKSLKARIEQLNKKIEETEEGSTKKKIKDERDRIDQQRNFIKGVLLGEKTQTMKKGVNPALGLLDSNDNETLELVQADETFSTMQTLRHLPKLSEIVITSIPTSFIGGTISLDLVSGVLDGFTVYQLIDLQSEVFNELPERQQQIIETIKEEAEKLKKDEIDKEEFRERIKGELKQLSVTEKCTPKFG